MKIVTWPYIEVADVTVRFWGTQLANQVTYIHTDRQSTASSDKIKAWLSSVNSWGLYVTVSFGSSPPRLIHIHRQIKRSLKHPHHPGRRKEWTSQRRGMGRWEETSRFNGCHLPETAWIWAYAGLCVRVGAPWVGVGWGSVFVFAL